MAPDSRARALGEGVVKEDKAGREPKGGVVVEATSSTSPRTTSSLLVEVAMEATAHRGAGEESPRATLAP